MQLFKITKNGYMDFSNMSLKRNTIDWGNNQGKVIKFKYNDIVGEIIYLKLIDNKTSYKRRHKILYNNKEYIVSNSTIIKGALGKVLNGYYDFKYKIGDIIRDDKRNLQILNCYNKDGAKYYSIKCLDCGYKYDTRQSDLIKEKGCAVCHKRKVVIGINDFNTKYPNLSKFIVTEEDKNLTCTSYKQIKWKCPHCNEEYYDSINAVLRRGLKCPFCERKYSFGETCMLKLLTILNEKYEHQKIFNWAKDKIYDFYLPRFNTIIEIHGSQHFGRGFGTMGGRSLEEEQENDKLKEELAINNGIDNYIIIDCKESTIKYFKNSVFNSQLSILFDLTNIFWDELYNYSIDNMYTQVCDLYIEGLNATEIGEKLNIERHYVAKLLKYANSKGNLSYSIESNKIARAKGQRNKASKPIRCVDTNHVFQSLTNLRDNSKEAFGFYVSNNNISRQIRLNKKHFGLSFEYISKEEFNNIKQNSPELAFGEFFIL